MIDEAYSLETIENKFAAWLDGALTPSDEDAFMNFCSRNVSLQEVLDANDQVEEAYEYMVYNGYVLPCELNGDFELPSIEDFGECSCVSYGCDTNLYDENEMDDDYDDISDLSEDSDIIDYGLI